MISQRAAGTVILGLGALAAALYLAIGVHTSATALEQALGGNGCVKTTW